MIPDPDALERAEWVPFSFDPVTGVKVWYADLGNGMIVHKTEYYATEELMDLNAEKRAVQAGMNWGTGKTVASVPLNIAQEKILPALNQGDQAAVKRFLNDPDYKKFRTYEGQI